MDTIRTSRPLWCRCFPVPSPQQGQAQTWHRPPGEATLVWGEMGADASAEELEGLGAGPYSGAAASWVSSGSTVGSVSSCF